MGWGKHEPVPNLHKKLVAIIKKNTHMENGNFKTGSGAIWNINKPISTSLSTVSNPKLTGKFEDHEIGGTTESMLEVDHDFGKDFIWEQFISQI